MNGTGSTAASTHAPPTRASSGRRARPLALVVLRPVLCGETGDMERHVVLLKIRWTLAEVLFKVTFPKGCPPSPSMLASQCCAPRSLNPLSLFRVSDDPGLNSWEWGIF